MGDAAIRGLILFFSLALSNVHAQGDVGYFLQVTDIHYDLNYHEGAYAECVRDTVSLPCCHTWEIPTGARLAGTFGDYNCDSPMSLLKSTFEFISTMNPKPDFVLWTGDDPGHSDLTQSPSQNLNAIDTITELLTNYLPGVEVYPALGNHDTWPVDQMANPPGYSWLLDKVNEYWQRWLPNKDIESTLKYGGYYSVLLRPGFRIISINTLLYDSHNKLISGEDPAGQWQWLNDTLAQSQQNKEVVWIIGHIFPGNGEATEKYSQGYQKLVSTYRDTIGAQFFGHSHKDQYTLTRFNGAVNGMLYIAPSVTPQSVMNPSVRMYKYNRNTSEVLDFTQWTADLNEANKNERVEFEILYSAKDAYGLPDMSTASWANLAERMKMDDALFQQYWINFNGNVTNMPGCDGPCKVSQLCSIQYSTQTEIGQCTKTGKM